MSRKRHKRKRTITTTIISELPAEERQELSDRVDRLEEIWKRMRQRHG